MAQVSGSEVVFLDASAQEEAACPDRVHCFFNGRGRVCGLRLEGGEGIDAARIRPLLLVSPKAWCLVCRSVDR